MNVFRHSFFLIKERIFYMYLNEECLKSKELLSKINIKLPLFNRKRVQENTKKNPKWIHFGPGNIFRAFIANLQQS